MSKQISSDMLESILTKVTDKFADVMKSFVGQLLDGFSTRIAHLESKVDDLNNRLTAVSTQTHSNLLVTGSTSGAVTNAGEGGDPMLKALLTLELEKSERAKRARNVVITGLAPESGTHDADLLAEFCDQHLTVKPYTLRSSFRRVGKSVNGAPIKLRVTLDSDEAVDDLIAASTILRDSTDPRARRIYFNRDLTPMEAQAAYEMRQKRRGITGQSGPGHGRTGQGGSRAGSSQGPPSASP
jgi:hypothetical protein